MNKLKWLTEPVRPDIRIHKTLINVATVKIINLQLIMIYISQGTAAAVIFLVMVHELHSIYE